MPYALISGIDHRIETHNIGMRDLTDSVIHPAGGAGSGRRGVAGSTWRSSMRPSATRSSFSAAPCNSGRETSINPSGGVLAGNLMMASGLSRVGEVFNRIVAGEAQRGVAHATSGPCLQHNLVTVVEKA